MDETIKKEPTNSENLDGNVIKEEKLEWCSCQQECKEECKHDCKKEIKEEKVEYVHRTLEDHIDNALITGSLGLAVDASFLHEDEQIQKRIKREATDVEYSTQVNIDESVRDYEGDEPDKRMRKLDEEVTISSVPVSKHKIMKCSQCTFIYTKQDSLKLHQIVHTTEPPYTCTHCQYETAHCDSFNKHIRSHSNDKPYPCQFCNYGAHTAGNIRSHIKLQHPTSGIICCSICNYKGTSSAMMIKHNEDVHADGKCIMKCPECAFPYKKSESMKLHKIIHTTKLPYKCSQCGYETSQASHFNRHIRVHTGDKPYSCEHCDSCHNVTRATHQSDTSDKIAISSDKIRNMMIF